MTPTAVPGGPCFALTGAPRLVLWEEEMSDVATKPAATAAGLKRSPLGGLRVVDFSHFIAGPVCTMILADLGADVIKIENAVVNGDALRTFQPQVKGESAAFLWANRNKRSVALDLNNQAACDVARDLIATADVVVENFSATVMKRFGLDYASVSATNPKLVYCSISAYGRTGPLADRNGFDPVVQAESGFMALNGDPDRDPLRTGPAVMDMSTGMMASNAVLAALMAREKTGKGQQVEVALFDVATTMLGFHAMNYLVSRRVPLRFGNNSRDTAPMGVVKAADGPIYLAIANDRLFRRLATDVLDRGDLADQPEFRTNSDRTSNREQLFSVLNGIFATQGRDHWLRKMRAVGVPAGAVRELPDAMASEEIAARGSITRIPHPKLGEVPNIASPIRLEGTPTVSPVAAPMLGQHTAEVLEQLGYTRERITGLEIAGALGKQGGKRNE
jgi:crotonobetainyl-CoA:carnitine CoA-transferase CaiB-like acyl-CoA transferase